MKAKKRVKPRPLRSPARRTEVEKCVLLIPLLVSDELTEPRSSGSHFSLCFLPRLILISQRPNPPLLPPLLPGEDGVQRPTSVHDRPPWHANSSPACSTARWHAKIKGRGKKIERQLRRIGNNSPYVAAVPSSARSRRPSAHSARQSAPAPPAWETSKNLIFYPDKLPY